MDTVFVILQSSQRSQILHKKISTHLLTLLIMGVILHLEQRKGQKMPKTESEFSESFSLNQIK